MPCTTTDDTNRTLDVVIVGVEELIGWARADAQQSRESEAPVQARQDMHRVRKLQTALMQLEGCRR